MIVLDYRFHVLFHSLLDSLPAYNQQVRCLPISSLLPTLQSYLNKPPCKKEHKPILKNLTSKYVPNESGLIELQLIQSKIANDAYGNPIEAETV
jgi:hypothetical protein